MYYWNIRNKEKSMWAALMIKNDQWENTINTEKGDGQNEMESEWKQQ